MKKILILLIGIVAALGLSAAQEAGPPVLQETILLPSVAGRLGHLGIDRARQRLFVAAYSNNSLEVIDLREGRVTTSIPGFAQPQDVLYVPDTGRLYVTSNDDGTLKVLDGETFAVLSSFAFTRNADVLRYDEKARRIYVGAGDGTIGVVDARTDRQMGTIIVSGHPAAFEIDRGKGRMYINTPSENRVVVADLRTLTPVGSFQLEGNNSNFAMALDAPGRRLFIGCRHPGSLVIFDCDSGRQVGALSINDGINDMFYDDTNQRLYCSCGDGAVDIISRLGADEYAVTEKITTPSGSSSSLFLPEAKSLFLAVPDFENPNCEIRRYSVP